MNKLKSLFTLHASLFTLLVAVAQQGAPNVNIIKDEGRAPYRTEFISYDIRGEADADLYEASKYFKPLLFKLNTAARTILFETTVEIPELWLERNVYIRDTGRTGRYRLTVNGQAAGMNTESYGTYDYWITPYLQAGANKIALEFTPDIPGGDMERFELDVQRLIIENLHIWSQPKIHIFDYIATGHYDEEYRDAVIDLAVVVANGYNMPETVTVGYDIYDPNGRLVDYTFKEGVKIPGRGCDTVRFYNKIMRTEKYQYSAENTSLYRVVLTLKYGGRNIEYIPFRLGFGLTEFDGTDVRRSGKTVFISAVEQDAPVQRNTLRRLRLMKRRGINTLYVTRPQQKWFYDMCALEGLYIIDRAGIECDPMDDDRGPEGTVANRPELLARFLDRQQAMFYRNRNRPNVIGWAIGGESGNGFNMYRAYRFMHALDETRPAVYQFAEGEWNTDIELPAPQPLTEILEGMTGR